MNARYCPSCRSIGPRRTVGFPDRPVPCPDPWHVRDGVRIDPVSLPPDSDPDRHVDAPGYPPESGRPADAVAVDPMTVSERTAELARESLGQPTARRIDDLCRMLAEEEARHQIAEREAADLRAALALSEQEAEDAKDGGLGLVLESIEYRAEIDRLTAEVQRLREELAGKPCEEMSCETCGWGHP